MQTQHPKQNRHFAFLICCIISIILAHTAHAHKGTLIFTRLGAVIELEKDLTKAEFASLQTASEFKPKITPMPETTEGWQTADIRLRPIDTKRLSVRFSWEPNTDYRLTYQWQDGKIEAGGKSPLKPVAYRVRTVELDSLLSLLENLQRPAKPTTVAFSPDAKRLAIATNAGHLAVIQPLTGEIIWKTRISEGYAKHAVFSPDGKKLYIGEQAADGFIYAYELAGAKSTLSWKYRIADDIDTSHPQDVNDVYAWIQYPGPYRIAATEGGDVFVAGVHSWTKEGVSLKKSQLYRFAGETGDLKWKWPKTGVMPMIIRWFDYSRDGKTIAVVCDTPGGQTQAGFKPGTLYLLDGETGETRWEHTFEPLTPYFEKVTFWRGLSVSPDGQHLNLTTDDGRAFIFNTTDSSQPVWQSDLTTPLEVSGIPITATAGTIGATPDFALFVTGDTYIPYHLQKGSQQPPSAHPNGMTLFAHSWTGEKVWQWSLENMPQGLRVDAEGRYAAVSLSKFSRNIDEQLHGVSVFDLTTEGGGLAKYLYTYRTEGQLPYDTLDISADGGLIAVIETPIKMADETVRGRYRVHLVQ